MVILPRVRCPGCGKTIHAVKAKEVPRAEKLEDCLRRCNRCQIGATNAKSLAKVRFIGADGREVPARSFEPKAGAPAEEPEQAPPAPEAHPQPETKPEPGTKPEPETPPQP